jgi:hypothetical protein
MKALAAREAQIWQQVETLLDTGRKIVSIYDEATVFLEKLKLLAEFQYTRDVFRERMHPTGLKLRHAAIIDRSMEITRLGTNNRRLRTCPSLIQTAKVIRTTCVRV